MRPDLIGNLRVIACAIFIGKLTLLSNVAAAGEYPYKSTIEAQAVGFPAGVYQSSGIASGLGKITESGNYHFVGLRDV